MPVSARLALLAVLVAGVLAAEEDLPIQFGSKYGKEYIPAETSIVATRVEQAPKLDGTLDDPVWNKQAARTRSAFTNFPSKDVCSRHTVVYCCYDDAALYLAFDCEETEIEQQDVDGKNISAADHVGVHLEIGDTRGRGRRCTVIGNRSGYALSGPWSDGKLTYVCKAGPNRWFVEMAIPFADFAQAGAPLRGERWGLKLTRYGRNTGSGASRMRSAWPHIPTISEDVLAYGGTLCFGADDMLANGALQAKDGAVGGWQTVAGACTAGADGLSAANGATLRQSLKLRGGQRYALAWEPGKLGGSVAVLAGDAEVAKADLGGASRRLGWATGKDGLVDTVIELKLSGAGAPPRLSLSSILDDVPADWICLTNNDWVAERNLKNRIPGAPEGTYTYLKTPMSDFGRSFYRATGCPDPNAKDFGDWGETGKPNEPPIDAPPARPDIGPEEFENTPFEVTYISPAVPEFCGLISGSFDVGGRVGSIPFSKGGLTGDPSWAGWPVDRWSRASPHDIMFDFKDRYYIRRVDIQQINTGVRNLEVLVRSDADPSVLFAPVYRFNGPGTQLDLASILPPYFSLPGIDSVGQQLRLSLGVTGKWNVGPAVSIPNLGRPNCEVGLYGICEIWVWAEPKGAHADDEIKIFKPYVPDQAAPLAFDQLRKLPEPVIWPRPKQMERGEGRFAIAADTPIGAWGGGSVASLAQRLRATLADRYCVEPACADGAAVADGARAIHLGVAGTGDGFDQVCRRAAIVLPVGRPQAYALVVTADAVVVAGADLEGLRHGVTALGQWLDHDEQRAFLRAARVLDWPSVRMRTVVPSSDHRQPLLPAARHPHNFTAIVDALAELRFDSLLDWMPTESGLPDEEARRLIHYASERSVEIRPALWVRDVPGDCLEINPDQQPDGRGGIGNSDGTYESDNLCPSNPKTYRAIGDFLDRALATHDDCRFIDVGFMGALGKAWNVCRACRDRKMDSYALYAGFINQIDRLCRARGRAPIFTNAILFSEGLRQAGQEDPAKFFGEVNAGITMRLDRAKAAQDIVAKHLWGVSKPFDTPAPLSGTAGAYGWGGPGFYDTIATQPDMEAVVVAGETCDYEWRWRNELSGQLLFVADSFWNGTDAPPTPPAEFLQMAANACVRLNERHSTGMEYPSWRTGMTPKFFTVDIRAACNRSHIDDGSASGPGRSGAKEGVNGFGAAFDFRRVPLGKSTFADIPFEIIDPASNKWRSMVVVGAAPREALIPGAVDKAVIPIGRKAASLCVLRTILRTVQRSGQLEHYFGMVRPAYVLQYADGTRYLCDREQRRHFNEVWAQCFFYGANLQPNLGGYCMASCRLGYATNTLSGAGATLFVNEFVNPFPDKEIASLAIQLPNPEERNSVLEYHEAIVAVTGVEPTAWDTAWWARHPARELVSADAAVPAGSVPVGLPFKDSADGPRKVWRAGIEPAAPIDTVSFRLAPSGASQQAMRRRHVDVTVSVSEDGTTWKPVATVPGCCGADGDHVVAVPGGAAVKGVLIVLDPTAYPDEEPRSDFGLYAAGATRRP